jgi:methylenetetrahydrofolate reductase (NADPH)
MEISKETVKAPVATDFCIGVGGYPEKHAEAPTGKTTSQPDRRWRRGGVRRHPTFYDNARYYAFVMLPHGGHHLSDHPGLKPLSSR